MTVGLEVFSILIELIYDLGKSIRTTNLLVKYNNFWVYEFEIIKENFEFKVLMCYLID